MRYPQQWDQNNPKLSRCCCGARYLVAGVGSLRGIADFHAEHSINGDYCAVPRHCCVACLLPSIILRGVLGGAGGGSLRGVADSFPEHAATNGDRDHIGGVDIMYLKNVLLKFLDSVASGRSEQVYSHSI